MKHHLTCQSVDSSASNISYHYDMVWENFSLATSGFRLRPEAGRFVRLFSIPCLVLWFQYLRDFFIIVICVWLSISWIYWLEDNRIFISATLLFFFFCLSSGIFDWFSVSFQRNWSDHFVFIPARPSWKGNLQEKTHYTCWSNICWRNEKNNRR